jgi:hypothetical protein
MAHNWYCRMTEELKAKLDSWGLDTSGWDGSGYSFITAQGIGGTPQEAHASLRTAGGYVLLKRNGQPWRELALDRVQWEATRSYRDFT